jgi:hypothetical protein
VSSEVPKEASDVANAVADRYQSVREADSKRLFEARENVIGDEITEQENVAAQKLSAVETIRSQLDKAGIHIAPGAGGADRCRSCHAKEWFDRAGGCACAVARRAG